MTEISRIDSMTGNTEQREEERKTVYKNKQSLHCYDGIDKSRKKLSGKHGVFFYEFGQIVEPRRWMNCCQWRS